MTGELALFKEIWKGREHVSQVHPHEEIFFDIRCFMHIVPKSTYGRFRLLRQNIVLATPMQHDIYDHATDQARMLKEFDWVFALRDVFVQLYHDVPRQMELEGSKYWKEIQRLYQQNLIRL